MFTVYKITNNITKEYYIGVHNSEAYRKNYFGSGLRIKRSIKKYGKSNFSKEILFNFKKESEAYNKEKELLDSHLLNKNCLNLARGGKGGANFTGKQHSINTKKKIGKASKGRKISVEVKEKLRDLQLGHKTSTETKQKISNSLKGRKLDLNHKKKISESLKNYYKNLRKSETE